MNNSTNQKATSLKSLKKYVAVSMTLLTAMAVFDVFLYRSVGHLEEKNTQIEETVKNSQEANEKVLAKLEEIRDSQKELEKLKQMQVKKEQEHKYTILQLKTNGLSAYDDLGKNTNVTVEDMNAIIDYYDGMINGGTPFKGKGAAFIAASEKSGLNPIYIFAHAACESGFGNSYLATTRGNYFGINAVDTNPDLASTMGDSVESGIEAGAMWIKENYYDNGYKTLDSMKSAGYATSDTWLDTIISIANQSIDVI